MRDLGVLVKSVTLNRDHVGVRIKDGFDDAHLTWVACRKVSQSTYQSKSFQLRTSSALRLHDSLTTERDVLLLVPRQGFVKLVY
jgi:hypothetical protein